MTDNFKVLTKKEVLANTNIRKYETKMGEILHCCNGDDLERSLEADDAKYVVIGIPEQAGVLANYGRAGTESLWPAFFKSFVNIQSNRYLTGNEIFMGGYFDFGQEMKLINATAPDPEERTAALKRLVEKIDTQVEDIVKIVTRKNKIPILIGGGHNNAYGAIKGAAKGLLATDAIPLAQICAINLDAHTDYRMQEGRHSGNGFRYADADGYLNKYFVIGAHENYLQQYVLKDIAENPFIDYVTFEDIFIREFLSFGQAVSKAIGFMEGNYAGIELDLDAIQNTLSSAATPCGVTPLDARKYLHFVGKDSRVAYLHICEGAVKMENGSEDPLSGKLVAYLVTDFLKSHLNAGRVA